MIDLVYVLGSTETRRVKIGHSTDVPKRLAGIQRMSPVPLTVLDQFEGGVELEAALHAHFRPFRTHGEWFDFGSSDPLAVIQEAVQTCKATAVLAEKKARPCKTAVQSEANIRALAELDRLTVAYNIAKQRRDDARDAVQEAIVRHLRERNAPPGKIAEHSPYDRNHVGRLAKAAEVPPLRTATVKPIKPKRK